MTTFTFADDAQASEEGVRDVARKATSAVKSAYKSHFGKKKTRVERIKDGARATTRTVRDTDVKTRDGINRHFDKHGNKYRTAAALGVGATMAAKLGADLGPKCKARLNAVHKGMMDGLAAAARASRASREDLEDFEYEFEMGNQEDDAAIEAIAEDIDLLITKEGSIQRALESIDSYGDSPALEHYFDSTYGFSIHGLHDHISQEGVVDFVKEKVGRLATRVQEFANRVYGKVTRNQEHIDHLIERARAHGESDMLPIGKVTSIIVAIGGLAALGAAAAAGGRVLASNSSDIKAQSAKIRHEAEAKAKDLVAKIRSRAKTQGDKISGDELKSLSSRIADQTKSALSSFGQHLARHKGAYATAAGATSAVVGAYGVHRGLKSFGEYRAEKRDQRRQAGVRESNARRNKTPRDLHRAATIKRLDRTEKAE